MSQKEERLVRRVKERWELGGEEGKSTARLQTGACIHICSTERTRRVRCRNHLRYNVPLLSDELVIYCLPLR